jgi:arylsulfatase A-like enzyme
VIFLGANVDRYGTSSFPLQLTDVYDLLLSSAGLAQAPLFGLLSKTALEPSEPERLRASECVTLVALRRGHLKYIVHTEPLAEELYNLADDPGERTNVADRELAVKERFREDAAALWPKRFPLWGKGSRETGAAQPR